MLGNCSNPGMTNTWHVHHHLPSLLSWQTSLMDHDSLSPVEPGQGFILFLHSFLLGLFELQPFYLERSKPFVSKQTGILMNEGSPGKDKATVSQCLLHHLDMGVEWGAGLFSRSRGLYLPPD